jgi:hypothetical protein
MNLVLFLSALNKILFPYVSNYGSKGRDAVKNSISTVIPFLLHSVQYNHQLPKSTVTIPYVTYHVPFVTYHSPLVTYHSRLLLITELHKVTGYVKIAHVTPVSITA